MMATTGSDGVRSVSLGLTAATLGGAPGLAAGAASPGLAGAASAGLAGAASAGFAGGLADWPCAKTCPPAISGTRATTRPGSSRRQGEEAIQPPNHATPAAALHGSVGRLRATV